MMASATLAQGLLPTRREKLCLVLRLFLAVALLLQCGLALQRASAGENEAGERRLVVDGRERKYLIYVPSNLNLPVPVVLVFHRGGGDARQMERYTGFSALAEKERFVVVYPEAVEGSWNDGRAIRSIRAQRENIDDVKFTRSLLDAAAKECKIDRERVFATGYSSGAIMSHRLAAEASDMIAAAALVAGYMAPKIYEQFNPTRPVSVLLIHGDADRVAPINGAEIALGDGTQIRMIAAKDALAKYLKRNGNPNQPTHSTIGESRRDGTSIEVTKYPDGPGGIKTEYYRVANGGHTWPGARPDYPESIVGTTSRDFSATKAIWAFFKSCPTRTARAQAKEGN